MRLNNNLFLKGKKIITDDFRELLTARKISLEPELVQAQCISESIGIFQKRWPINSEENDSEAPVFLLSAGWRSGSTLLQRLILSSGEIALWGEPLGNSGTIARLCHSLTAITDNWPSESYFAAQGTYDDASNQWVANLTPPMKYLRDAHRQFFLQWLQTPANSEWGKIRWGLKEVRLTVHHAFYLQWLFPKARFVFICRHPYDAYNSWKGNRWRDRWPSYYHKSPVSFARHWHLLVDGYLKHGHELDAIFIKFEDLVEGAVDLKKLAIQLGLKSFDESILQRKIRGPLQQTNRQRKGSLTLVDKFLIKKICKHRMHELGYDA